MEQHGMEMIEMCSGGPARNKELPANVRLRSPDVVFDTLAGFVRSM